MIESCCSIAFYRNQIKWKNDNCNHVKIWNTSQFNVVQLHCWIGSEVMLGKVVGEGVFCYEICWFASWTWICCKRDTFVWLQNDVSCQRSRNWRTHGQFAVLFALKTCLKRVEHAHNHVIITWSILHVWSLYMVSRQQDLWRASLCVHSWQ